MGARCSCQTPEEDSNLEVEKKPEPANHSKRPNLSIKLPLLDIIKVQSSLRGYIARREVRSVLGGKSAVISFDGGKALQEIDEVPEYANPATLLTEKKLGEYEYNYSLGDKVAVIPRKPVLLDNGAVYVGEWNQDNERHGKGMQIWSDGSKYEGYWKGDKAAGKGRLIHADRSGK